MEESSNIPALPAGSEQPASQPSTPEQPGSQPVNPEQPANDQKQRQLMIVLVTVFFLFLIIIISAVVFLLQADTDTTAKVRDVFIIFMALEFIILGVALVILIIQLATLINLLQNELKPLIELTNETVNTLRGTASFLSDNVSEPVIKLNAYLAGFKQFFDVVMPRKNKKR